VGAVQAAQQVAGILGWAGGFGVHAGGTHTGGGLVGSVVLGRLSDPRGYFISGQLPPPLRAELLVTRLAIGLLLVFTAVILRSLAEGSQADCGCFGSSGADRVSWFSIVRNAVLIALAVVAALPVDGWQRPPLPGVLAGVGVGLTILLLDQALAIFPNRWLRPNDVWE
jgi:hypothetical protein